MSLSLRKLYQLVIFIVLGLLGAVIKLQADVLWFGSWQCQDMFLLFTMSSLVVKEY
jgi:hypothetical protein